MVCSLALWNCGGSGSTASSSGSAATTFDSGTATGAVTGAGGGGSSSGSGVGCTDAAGCSDSWASSTLDASWSKDPNFSTCVGTFTVTGGSPGNLNFAMSDANGNTCAAQGPSYMYKNVASSVTNATFTLTFNSWQNMSGGSISLLLEPQSGTSTEVGLASTSTYRDCFVG